MLTLIHKITFLIYSKFVNEGVGFFDIVNVSSLCMDPLGYPRGTKFKIQKLKQAL